MTMADTVAVMNAGVIEQMGSPIDLYESPRTAFVANFLGQSNLLSATVTGTDGDDVLLTDADGAFRVPKSRVADGVDVTSGRQVLVGVRPEKINAVPMSLAGDAPVHGNFVDGTVVSALFTGVSTQYEVATRGGDVIGVFVQNLRPGAVLDAGTPVRLSWDAGFAFILDGNQDPHAGESHMHEGE